MKRKLGTLSLIAAAALAVLGAGTAQAQTSVPIEAAENGRLWFVELAGNPTADGRSLSAVRAEKDAFRRAARAAGIRFTERRSFDVLFNGFSIDVGPRDRAKLMALGGVKAIYPVEVIQAPTPEQAAGSALDLARAIDLTGARIAQDTLGLTGRGINVGIVDTGIDIDHPAFGGSGAPGTTPFPSPRVAFGYDFVGDDYDSSGTPAQQVPQPDQNPDDCGGHGTHVAGIVGGSGGGIRGVAPGVTFGAYRVFGCTGTSSSDVIVAALERAYADGMQIINQSLGAARQWPQYPTAQASTRLVNKGVVMVASIGNNGPGGSSPDALFAAGAPGVGSKVIGVASYDNAQAAFTVNGTPYGYNPASGAPLPPTTGSLPMAKTGTTATTNDGCAALPPGSLTGMAALIRRGTCSFAIKAVNAQAAGAAAVVLYNNQAGALNATVAGGGITIPVVGITAAQGATLDAAIAAGPTTLNWTADSVGWPFGTGGLISGFSSFGLAADLTLKPQIGAPGGGILSSYPLELGGAATLSGTSMSAPHVAGGIALILEADPKIPAQSMATRIQNTADPKAWSGNPPLGLLDHVHRQGAGMLDIMGTIQATATVSPSQLSLGESQAGPQERRIEVKNRSSTPVTYTVTHVPGLATGPNTQTGASYNISNVYDAPATVTFSNRTTFTVQPHGEVSFVVTIDANPALPDRSLYGGYIVLTPSNGTAPLRVPFAGFKGDYQSTQVLTPTANGFPWLSQLQPCPSPATGLCYGNRPGGATYTMNGDDIPFFLIHLDHLSRRVVLEANDATSGRTWHKISLDDYMTRNSTPGGFFAFAWDGTTFRGKGTQPNQWLTVPNGNYVVTVKVLKALGNEANPAHWETWTSPVVTIARP